jgi:transglutaminase-like putative cysteine protease
MSQKETLITVTGKEVLTVLNKTYDTYRLEAEVWGKPLALWVDENGVILKEQGVMGLTLLRSSATRAPLDIEGDRQIDLYEITAVRPDRPLRDPLRLTRLKVKIEGIDQAYFIPMGMEGGRQRVAEGVLSIQRERYPVKAAYSLSDAHPAEMKPYLASEFNIESDAPEIIRKARDISGNEKDPVAVARRLLQWVHGNLEKKPTLVVPSALEALRTKVGDCNEHATLLTALLRASNIPARLSIGLVYTRENFYYHAWTEAYVGSWISMDATLNQIPADATHIKFLEGNLERQVEMVRVMGELKLKVVDFGHD